MIVLINDVIFPFSSLLRSLPLSPRIFPRSLNSIFVGHCRRQLNRTHSRHKHHTFAYIWTTIAGFLQLVGCLGALRLSEKLLNAYWLLLLVLLIGDAVLGIFWMFKFDRIMHELQPMLRFVYSTI